MKSFSFLLQTFRSKYTLSTIIVLMSFAPMVSAQKIYTDDGLWNTGYDAYSESKYDLAELYLFAYVQRNTEQYQSNVGFQNNLDSALDYSIAHSDMAGVQARVFMAMPIGHNNPFLQKPELVKPVLNVSTASKKSALVLFSGMYRCNDGNIYYIKMIKEEVWWYFHNVHNNYTGVMHGFISGNLIKGYWSSLPLNQLNNSGTVVLRLISRTAFTAVSQTGGLSGTSWNKVE